MSFWGKSYLQIRLLNIQRFFCTFLPVTLTSWEGEKEEEEEGEEERLFNARFLAQRGKFQNGHRFEGNGRFNLVQFVKGEVEEGEKGEEGTPSN